MLTASSAVWRRSGSAGSVHHCRFFLSFFFSRPLNFSSNRHKIHSPLNLWQFKILHHFFRAGPVDLSSERMDYFLFFYFFFAWRVRSRRRGMCRPALEARGTAGSIIEFLMKCVNHLRLWSMNINHLCSTILRESGPQTVSSLTRGLVSSQRRGWLMRFQVWLSRIKKTPSGVSPSLLMSRVMLRMICVLHFLSLLCLCQRLSTSLRRAFSSSTHAVTVTSSGGSSFFSNRTTILPHFRIYNLLSTPSDNWTESPPPLKSVDYPFKRRLSELFCFLISAYCARWIPNHLYIVY